MKERETGRKSEGEIKRESERVKMCDRDNVYIYRERQIEIKRKRGIQKAKEREKKGKRVV